MYLPSFLVFFGQGLLLPVLPIYAKSFDISYGLVGLLLAAPGLGTLVSDVPVGIIVGRMRKKTAMVLGLVLTAVTVFALFWARSAMQAFLLRFAFGVVNSLWQISRHTYLTSLTAPDRRGRTMSVFGGIMRIGVFLGPALGGLLASKLSLRAPFLFYAFGVAIAVVLLIFFVREAPNVDQRNTGGSRRAGGLLSVLRKQYRILLRAGAGQLCASMIRRGRDVLIPLYAVDVVGLGLQSVGLILSIAAFVDMTLFYPAGQLMDKLGRKFAIVPSFLIQGIGMLIVALTHSFGGLLAATCLIGFGNGLGAGSMMTLGADLAPRKSIGEFLGLWRLIGDSGSVGSPLVVGSIADALSLTVSTVIIGSFGIAASAVFAFLVPETNKRRIEEKSCLGKSSTAHQQE